MIYFPTRKAIVPDLRDALALTALILFARRDEHPFLRTAILGNLYASMKILLDVMNGMLACEEVARLAGAGSRPRKRIPVKIAAAIFETHPNTIGNWDKDKGRPPEYLGRDVDEELLRASADNYFRRRHNEEQAKRNRTEGLTHRSAAPHSGPDSTCREHNRGNFRISTENGRRTPL